MIRQLLVSIPAFILCSKNYAQTNLSFQCAELNINKSVTVNFESASEDDPAYLQEAVAFLQGKFLPGNQMFELIFPSRVGTYHWQQEGNSKDDDSLAAALYYDTNPSVYGNLITCHAKDFTITVTKYESAVHGAIEGNFSGTMTAFVAGIQKSVDFEVKGNFHTIRSGGVSAECRKLRSTEQKAVDKLKDAINLLAEKWVGGDYQFETVIIGKEVAAGNTMPMRPLMICDNRKLVLKLKEDSKLYQTKVEPLETDYSSSGDFSEAKMYHLKNLQSTVVSIDVNCPSIWLVSHVNNFVPKSTEKISITGIDLGYKFCFKYDTTYILAFGDWNNLNPSRENADMVYRYKFNHGPHQPYIENVVLRFNGTDEALKAILQKTDWKILRNALTNN